MVSNSLRVCGVCESGGICDLQGYSRKLDVVFTNYYDHDEFVMFFDPNRMEVGMFS